MTLGELTGAGRTKTAHQYVLKSLREAILDGRLSGGSRLVQSDLASRLDVSITPVREALRDLASEGLVIFDPYRGALVRSLDLGEVREIYELRAMLEPVLVEWSFRTLQDERIDRAVALYRAMADTRSVAAWAELNRQFHSTLTEADGSSRLSGILENLRAAAAVYVMISLGTDTDRLAQSNAEHAELVETYRRRDLRRAKEMTVVHLRKTLDTIEEAHERGLL